MNRIGLTPHTPGFEIGGPNMDECIQIECSDTLSHWCEREPTGCCPDTVSYYDFTVDDTWTYETSIYYRGDFSTTSYRGLETWIVTDVSTSSNEITIESEFIYTRAGIVDTSHASVRLNTNTGEMQILAWGQSGLCALKPQAKFFQPYREEGLSELTEFTENSNSIRIEVDMEYGIGLTYYSYSKTYLGPVIDSDSWEMVLISP